MTIRNRLSLFTIIISISSLLVSAWIILYNASGFLRDQSYEALKSSGTAFHFFFNDYIDQNRHILSYAARNTDIHDYASRYYNLMTFVAKQAALEEMEKLKEENPHIKRIYIETDGELDLGDTPITGAVESGSYLKLENRVNACVKIEVPVGEGYNSKLVAVLDLDTLIRDRLNKVRINEQTHYYLYDLSSRQLLLHSQFDDLSLYSDTSIQSVFHDEQLISNRFISYSLDGTSRIAYLIVDENYLFGASIPLSTLELSRMAILQIGIVTIILISIMMVVISNFASRYLIRPLKEMADIVQLISERDYSRKLVVNGNDELAVVGQTINTMAQTIELYTENLEQLIDERTVQLQDALKEVKEISIRDGLTGIYNRKYYEDYLNNEIKRSERSRIPFGLIYIDLDHFKNVNDTYGHQQGDNVLIRVSKAVKNNIRSVDIFARWGGEEFIILLPNSDSEGLLHTAEKIRSVIEFIHHPEVGKITTSIGYTLWIDGDDSVSLVKRCDEALYRAKEEGRNCVRRG